MRTINLKNKLMITMTMLNKTLISLLLCLGLLSSTVQAAEKITYIHNDALGSPVAATDANGKLLWREDYKPYGERIRKETASKGNTLWYTGKPHEEDFGLSYFGARWYSPQMGRFTGIDPAGFSEGNVQSFNRYAYANNNPYRYVDPDGKAAILHLSYYVPPPVTKKEGYVIGAVVLGIATAGIADAYLGAPAAMILMVSATGEPPLGVAKGGKADFIGDSNGTAVRNSASGARRDLEAGGFPGRATTETLESGTLHRGVPGRDGPMDVRIMDGQANGGSFKGPRISTTRSGSANDGVRSDGSRFRNNENKSQRLRESHIHLGQ